MRILLLIALACLIICAGVVLDAGPRPAAPISPVPEAKPKGKPRKLTPAERRDSINRKKPIAEG